MKNARNQKDIGAGCTPVETPRRRSSAPPTSRKGAFGRPFAFRGLRPNTPNARNGPVPKASPVGTLTRMAWEHATPKDESASAYGVQRLAAAWEACVSRLERRAGATVAFTR